LDNPTATVPVTYDAETALTIFFWCHVNWDSLEGLATYFDCTTLEYAPYTWMVAFHIHQIQVVPDQPSRIIWPSPCDED
jgi:hypothetical protein